MDDKVPDVAVITLLILQKFRRAITDSDHAAEGQL